MKLNREQIMCILEHCSTDGCEQCILCKENGNCIDILAPQIFAIMLQDKRTIFELENRLKECENGYAGTLALERAKVKELTERVELWIVISKNYQRELDELVEANKELQDKLMVTTGEVESLTEENKRLKLMLDDRCDRCIERNRADTVREMRSRLYEEFLKVAHIQLANEPDMRSQEVFAILDQIAKEMLEGNERYLEKSTPTTADYHSTLPN